MTTNERLAVLLPAIRSHSGVLTLDSSGVSSHCALVADHKSGLVSSTSICPIALMRVSGLLYRVHTCIGSEDSDRPKSLRPSGRWHAASRRR